MLAIHDWKRDWVTEGHAQRQYFARNSLQRSFRGDSQRRVTSSSAPSSVAVVDCCWARGHRTGGTPSTVVSPLASCLFCALSGGGVCILNTTNFAKTYLFEGDAQQRQGRKDDRGQKKDAPQQHDGRRERLVAIDCQLVARRTVKEEAVPRTAAKGATTGAADESVALVCAVVDGWLCTFAVDADAVAHARSASIRAGGVNKAVELPSSDVAPARGAWERVCIRLSPGGTRIVVVTAGKGVAGRGAATSGLDNVQHATLFCVLKREAGETLEAYAVERPWTRVLPPSDASSVELLHVGWWDDDDSELITVWSDGTVSLLNMALETIGGTCVFSSREEQMPGRVTRATSVPPAFQVNSSGRSTVPREAGLVALVVDGNVVVVCTVHESPQLHVKATTPPPPPTTTATATEETETVGGEEPPLKSAKVEATEIVKQRRGLTLRPGHQTYCSEDIPIRDLALFDNFLPYTLAVLLESGAVVALDPATMELLYHRPLQRLFPPRGANTKQPPSDKRDAEAEKSVDTTRSGSYFFRPRERPLALCVMEHNTAVVLRPS